MAIVGVRDEFSEAAARAGRWMEKLSGLQPLCFDNMRDDALERYLREREKEALEAARALESVSGRSYASVVQHLPVGNVLRLEGRQDAQNAVIARAEAALRLANILAKTPPSTHDGRVGLALTLQDQLATLVQTSCALRGMIKIELHRAANNNPTT